MLSQTNGQKNELQIIQNDALRFANQVTKNDRISKVELHKKAKLLSLEQRRKTQLYTLMYKLSLRGMYRKIKNINTRKQQKYVFKTETKIGRKYEKSAYFIGTQMWDKLSKDVQLSMDVYEFKKNIAKMYKTFKEKKQ